jgi:hypothetical protein
MNRTILITNGRFPPVLNLIRNLYDAHHRIIVAETSYFHCCAFSKATDKNVLIPSPRECEEGYILTLLKVIKEEKVDLFIPGWEDALIVAKHLERFPKGVAFTSNYDLIHNLHNKWTFSQLLTRLGYKTPCTLLIKSPLEIEKVPFETFYIKTFYSRASIGTYFIEDKRTLPKIEISPKNPILIQEKLEGEQFCTFSICHQGKITAHSTYPLCYHKYDRTKSRGNYCLSLEEVDNPNVFNFVQDFVAKTNYTGNIGFDLFEHNGVITPLECNPRITAGVTLLSSQKNLSSAFFNENKEILFPKKGRQTQFLIPSLCIVLKKALKNGSFIPFIKTLFKAKDLLFDIKDLLPFLSQPVLWIYQLIVTFRHKKSIISSYSHDLDYEEAFPIDFLEPQ